MGLCSHVVHVGTSSGSVKLTRMETSIKCVKYSLFLFNLLFSLSGLFLIIAGGVVQAAYSQYLEFLGDQFFSTPMFLIVVGCIIFFVAFFGCCGAIKENHCMTLTFAVLLGVIFLMEIGAGVAAYKLKGQVNDLLYRNMECRTTMRLVLKESLILGMEYSMS